MKSLPSDAELLAIFKCCKEQTTRLGFFLLIVSGRRSVDISRLDFKNLKIKGNAVYCLLPREKSNRVPTSITFDITDDIWPKGIQTTQRKVLSRFAHTNHKPLGTNWLSSLRKLMQNQKVQWTLHSIRYRKAIKLACSNVSDVDIMKQLSWSSEASLKRYTVISTDYMRNNNLSYTEVQQMSATL